MTTREIIDRLKQGEIVDSVLVADRLEALMEYIDDLYGDHYIDNLDWYRERCWDLEDELLKFKESEMIMHAID